MRQEGEKGNGRKEFHDQCKGFEALCVDNVDHCMVIIGKTCMSTAPQGSPYSTIKVSRWEKVPATNNAYIQGRRKSVLRESFTTKLNQ